MVTNSMLVGRSFLTEHAFDVEPTWVPLEAIARLARTSVDLPPFHEAEFMYMGAVRNSRKRLTIHLYKHRDTRMYLNIDDGGHAYAYRHQPADCLDARSAGRYRSFGSLSDALDAADLWIFDVEPRFLRSFPPEKWPALDVSP